MRVFWELIHIRTNPLENNLPPRGRARRERLAELRPLAFGIDLFLGVVPSEYPEPPPPPW